MVMIVVNRIRWILKKSPICQKYRQIQVEFVTGGFGFINRIRMYLWHINSFGNSLGSTKPLIPLREWCFTHQIAQSGKIQVKWKKTNEVSMCGHKYFRSQNGCTNKSKVAAWRTFGVLVSFFLRSFFLLIFLCFSLGYTVYINNSGQIIIFHQPKFPWNKGHTSWFSPALSPPFRQESTGLPEIRGFPWLNHHLGWGRVRLL